VGDQRATWPVPPPLPQLEVTRQVLDWNRDHKDQAQPAETEASGQVSQHCHSLPLQRHARLMDPLRCKFPLLFSSNRCTQWVRSACHFLSSHPWDLFRQNFKDSFK
jgi:hypothetical protein